MFSLGAYSGEIIHRMQPGCLLFMLPQRYLKQTNLDIEEAHHRAGPVRDIEHFI
jgi:hypothetical protein